MKSELLPGERLIKEAGANLQRGLETVGGHLILTNRRLLFEPHRVNFQRGTVEVDVTEVESAEPCWTKFLGVFPVAPNSLVIRTSQGSEFRFVVWHRRDWDWEITTVTKGAN